MSSASTIKNEARRLIEKLADDATWEDLQYEIFVRQAIEAGLKDSDANRITSHEEARQRLGLDPK
jgi:predicted transcriptional regulator